MKCKFLISLVYLILNMNAVKAQIDEYYEFKVGALELIRSDQRAYEFGFSYNRNGLHVPVSIVVNSNLTRYDFGVGYKTSSDLAKLFQYSVSLVLSRQKYNESSTVNITEDDQTRILTLIKQEFIFHINQRFSVGINLDLEPLRFLYLSTLESQYGSAYSPEGRSLEEIKSLKNSAEYDGVWQVVNSNGTISYYRPKFLTKEERLDYIATKKNSTASSFGLSFKINLRN